MAGQRWSFILTKLDHTPIGEIHNAYERKIILALSKPSTVTFSILPSNPLMGRFFEDEDKLLQVWQGTTLRFWGIVVSAQYATQEDGTSPTIAISAADPSWRLSKRLSGKSKAGTAHSGDKAASARSIIDETNTEGETGIETISVESGSTGSYTAGPYKAVLSCIGDLAHGLDGFDWYIEPKTGSSSKIGVFKAAGTIGSEKPNAVFEYGAGKRNMRSMSFLRDLGGILNRAYHIPDEGLESETESVVHSEDATSIANHGLYEELVELTGVLNATLRTEWTANNVEVRKIPRRVLAMTIDVEDPLNPNHVPVFGTDFFLGDLVPARAVKEGVILFNGLTRVYQVNIEVDNNGVAKVTPILVDEAE